MKTLFYTNRIGYYYIMNNTNTTEVKFNDKKLRAFFYNLKFIFEYSKNNKYEKDMANAYFYKFISPINNNQLKKIISNDCKFYNDINKSLVVRRIGLPFSEVINQLEPTQPSVFLS